MALKNVDLSIKKGEIHVLLGENGAGKSTLIKCIIGAQKVDEGSISWMGKDITGHAIADSYKIGISVIYQELSNVHCLSIVENLFIGREIPAGLPGFLNWKEQRSHAKEILGKVGLGKIDIDTEIGDIGVGQQQLVEIGRAVSSNAKLIIMDEPTSSLGGKEIDFLLGLISDLKKEGISILFITHKLEEAKKVGDFVTVLKDGAKVGTKPMSEVEEESLVKMMVGKKLSEKYPKRQSSMGDVVFEAKNIVADKVHDVSFFLKKGELLGIYGLVGAGRTEAMKAVFGADELASADIFVNTKKVNMGNPVDAIKNGIVLLTEDRKKEGLCLIHDLVENINLPNLKKMVNVFGTLNKTKMRSQAVAYSEKVNIKPPGIDRLAMNYSGGNQQKIVIAKWLLSRANIFIFDEPTRGIDVGAKTEIYSIMNELLAQGDSIIMVSSEIQEILGMSDRILVMYDGKITGEFINTVDLTQEKLLVAAVGGKII